MVIGIDASRANRKHKTGTEWYSYHLIRHLAKIDSKNKYVLYTDKPLEGGLLDLTEESLTPINVQFDKKGYQVVKSPHNNFSAKILKWPFNFLWTQGRLSLEMFFSSPDVLFVPAHALPLIHPKKSIVTIHDIGFKRDDRVYAKDEMGPDNSQNLRRFLDFLARVITRGKFGSNSKDYLDWSTQYALRKAKKIITVSNFSKNEIVDIYGKSEEEKQELDKKVVVIHNGYNADAFLKKDDQKRIEEVLNKYCIEEPFILYAGRLDKKKNIPALIEAFAIMREKNPQIKHKLVLAGPANYGYDEINYMVGEFNLDSEVNITGWIPEDDLPYIFNSASLFVLPSLYEGFGIPLLQAMACHIPIAASNKASIPEIVGEAGLLFDPGKVYSIATAMEKIIINSEIRHSLVEKGKTVVGDFSWEKCARETLFVIDGMDG